MKKCIFSVVSAFTLCLALTGCNKQIIDTTYNFNSAIISLPNGEIVTGKVQSWKDYENSDQVQVKIDGVTYLIHSMNVALISD
jgi:ribosomal protein S1